jgi:hypothetical protein
MLRPEMAMPGTKARRTAGSVSCTAGGRCLQKTTPIGRTLDIERNKNFPISRGKPMRSMTVKINDDTYRDARARNCELSN